MWKNCGATIKRNTRVVVFCACMLVVGVFALGGKISYNEATAAANAGYDALRSAHNDKALSRGDFREALMRLVHRKHEAIGSMTGRDIRLIFGNPQQVRRDHGVHVWQYRTKDCVIDIYMREEDGQEASLQAAHHDLRKRRLIKVNGGDDNGESAGRDALTTGQRAGCLTTAFRNNAPGSGAQDYASLE